MARAVISSYTWREAKADYEKGMSQADIRKKYGIGAGALGNKIKRDGWRLSQEQKTALSEFKESSVKVSESFHNASDIQKNEIVAEIKTILEDNELVQNNRKLLKMAQSVIIKNKENFNHTNIKNLTGAIKDIETVANPIVGKTAVNIQNNNTQKSLEVTGIKVSFDED